MDESLAPPPAAAATAPAELLTPHPPDGSAQAADSKPGSSSQRGRTSIRSSTNSKLTRTVSLGKLVRYGVHSIQNLRPEMEDAHRVVLDVQFSEMVANALGNLSYFGVFDGHGGAQAAEFAGERLCGILASDRTGLREDPAEALRQAFARTEEEWLEMARTDELFDGTTAAVVLLDRTRKRCVVANVGDSEVLLGSRSKSGVVSFQALTEVHHVKRNDAEAVRVEAAGGRLWRGRLGHPKINPKVVSLAVTRAIGDLFFKDDRYTEGKASGLTAEPFVTSVEVRGEDVSEQFIVIGCDGFWDTVDYRKAADTVLAELDADTDPQTISEKLVHLARDEGSSDNITVMVVVL